MTILIHSLYFNISLPKVSKSDIMQLSALKGTPLEYTISAYYPLVHTPLCDVQIGSISSYQVHGYLKQSLAICFTY